MRKLIFIAILMLGVSVSAQETRTNVYITVDQPFIPKKGSQFGVSGSWDNTGILIGNFDVYPNNKVFLGVAFGSRDIINTEPLIFTEQIVAGRLGLRVLPWTYVVGTAGNHRFEPPVYHDYEGSLLAEGLPYKDEFFWGAGVQLRVPYIIFNNFKIVAGIMRTNRNSYEIDKNNFNVGSIQEVKDTFNHLISSDLTFTVGVTIPLN